MQRCCLCPATRGTEAPKPVEIIGSRYIHRDPSDADAKFYRRDEADAHVARLQWRIERLEGIAERALDGRERLIEARDEIPQAMIDAVQAANHHAVDAELIKRVLRPALEFLTSRQ